jgi:hypothetical protein
VIVEEIKIDEKAREVMNSKKAKLVIFSRALRRSATFGMSLLLKKAHHVGEHHWLVA